MDQQLSFGVVIDVQANGCWLHAHAFARYCSCCPQQVERAILHGGPCGADRDTPSCRWASTLAPAAACWAVTHASARATVQAALHALCVWQALSLGPHLPALRLQCSLPSTPLLTLVPPVPLPPERAPGAMQGCLGPAMASVQLFQGLVVPKVLQHPCRWAEQGLGSCRQLRRCPWQRALFARQPQSFSSATMALTTGPAGLSAEASGLLMRLTRSASSALRSCGAQAASATHQPPLGRGQGRAGSPARAHSRRTPAAHRAAQAPCKGPVGAPAARAQQRRQARAASASPPPAPAHRQPAQRHTRHCCG